MLWYAYLRHWDFWSTLFHRNLPAYDILNWKNITPLANWQPPLYKLQPMSWNSKKISDLTLQPPQIFTLIYWTSHVMCLLTESILFPKRVAFLLWFEWKYLGLWQRKYLERRSQIYACGCLSLGISVSLLFCASILFFSIQKRCWMNIFISSIKLSVLKCNLWDFVAIETCSLSKIGCGSLD